MGHHFEARKLGPNIIVGSAAFNLLIITSLCTLTLGLNEKRRIHDLKVKYFFTNIFVSTNLIIKKKKKMLI